jgi:BlaI family penicillinase repressor
MGDEMPHITAAELRVMKVLWRLGSGTVRQVLDALPAEGDERPAYTTVMTMMKQLAEKGALSVERERQPFVYTPAVRREHVLRSRVTQFLQTVFDGQAEDLVLHLAEEADLSPEDLRRIEAKIRQREQAEGQQRGRRRRRAEEGS